MKSYVIVVFLLDTALLARGNSYGCNPVADCMVNPDGLTPDPHHCHRYYRCDGTTPSEGSIGCPDNMWFNGVACVPGDCSQHPLNCYNNCNIRCRNIGDLIPHELDCSKYYTCTPSGVSLMSCNEGTFFDGTECTRYADACCVFCHYECDGLYDGHHVIDPNNCTRYYECNADEVLHSDCPKGEYFNMGLEACEPGVCLTYCGH